jgi:hypothetical protein
MGYWIIDGKQMTNEEYEEYKRQEQEAKERVRREVAERVRRLGQDYESLTRLLQENPGVGRGVSDQEAHDEEIFEKLRRNLQRADLAPRCRWVRQDGTCCGSPHMRKHIYCYAHKQMMEARAISLRLPALEDANAIQIAIMRVQTALIDQTISEKTAGLLLYSLQIAAANIEKTTFGQAEDGELVTEVVNEREALSQEALSRQHSAISKNPEKGSPLMNTDDTDKKDPALIEADEHGYEKGDSAILANAPMPPGAMPGEHVVTIRSA